MKKPATTATMIRPTVDTTFLNVIGPRVKPEGMPADALIEHSTGLGAMLAVEFVKNRGTLQPDPSAAERVMVTARNRGLLVIRTDVHSNDIRFLPPLTADAHTVSEAVDIFVALPHHNHERVERPKAFLRDSKELRSGVMHGSRTKQFGGDPERSSAVRSMGHIRSDAGSLRPGGRATTCPPPGREGI